MTQARHFIIDTDLNFPSDDLQALLLLMSAKDAGLVGVSACAGNTFAEECLVNIAALLDQTSMNHVPLARGASFYRFHFRRKNALRSLDQGWVRFAGSHQKALSPRFSSGDQEYAKLLDSFDVSGSLLELILRQDDKVDILCLGPLTNLADALRVRPDISEKIKKVWFMGANEVVSRTDPRIDFNVWYDPWAAKAVFESDIELMVFPYELCRRYRSDEWLVARVNEEGRTLAGRLFAEDFSGMAAQHGSDMPLCDQLVALAFLCPEVITTTSAVSFDVCLNEGLCFGSAEARATNLSRIALVTGLDEAILRGRLLDTVSRLTQIPLRSSPEQFVWSRLYRIGRGDAGI